MPGYSYGATGTAASDVARLRLELSKAQTSYDSLVAKLKEAAEANKRISAALQKKVEENIDLKEINKKLMAENKQLTKEPKFSLVEANQKIGERDRLIADLQARIEETPAPVPEVVTFEGYLKPGALADIQELVA